MLKVRLRAERSFPGATLHQAKTYRKSQKNRQEVCPFSVSHTFVSHPQTTAESLLIQFSTSALTTWLPVAELEGSVSPCGSCSTMALRRIWEGEFSLQAHLLHVF